MMIKLFHEEVQEGLKQARKERESELAELQEYYKVKDSDTPEEKERKRRTLAAAMLDP